MKIHPRRVSAHCVAVQTELVSFSFGKQAEAVGAHIERAENASALLRSLRIDQHPILGSLDAAVDLGRVGHPFDQVFGRRQIRQQMSEYLLRSLNKEAIGHPFWLVKRDGKRLCFGLAAQLLRRVPIGHSSIKRIEDDVAAMRVVELLHELAGRVVNDRAVAPRFDLVKHLANDARLACARVADDQEMLVLGISRNPQRQL